MITISPHMNKRPAIDSFFSKPKQVKLSFDEIVYDKHSTYPIPLPAKLPFDLSLNDKHNTINNLLELDLLSYTPLIPQATAKSLFEFLRSEFCWYRVTYQARGITINTPRFTTVFGLDDTHYFSGDAETGPVYEKSTRAPPKKPLNCVPRPMPGCLLQLKAAIEDLTSQTFNFCLLNYYKDGNDSISYHSDDEFFLGSDPTIVSISLGADRDFLMRHKKDHKITWKTALRGGDCVVMQGSTQSKWDHSIPKRKSGNTGRINITFRKAMIRAGTENYYRYNVNNGPYYRWNQEKKEMVLGDEYKVDPKIEPS